MSRGPVRFDRVSVDPETGEVLVDDKMVAQIARTRAVVLAVLLATAPRIASTARLLDALWGDRADGPSINSVPVYICHLRAMFRDHRIPLEIRTHWGRGYSVLIA